MNFMNNMPFMQGNAAGGAHQMFGQNFFNNFGPNINVNGNGNSDDSDENDDNSGESADSNWEEDVRDL